MARWFRSMTRAGIQLVGALFLAGALVPSLPACDSTGCLLVTRSASGLLPRKGFRLDLSYRATDDSKLMSGSDTATRVTRPKVDFEHGLVRPGFHQDLGGTLALPAAGRRLRAHRPHDALRLGARSSPTARTTSATRRCSRRTTRPAGSATRSSASGTPSSRRPRRAWCWARGGDAHRRVPAGEPGGALRHRRPRPDAAAGERVVGRAAERPGLAPPRGGRARPDERLLLPGQHHERPRATATATTRSRASRSRARSARGCGPRCS